MQMLFMSERERDPAATRRMRQQAGAAPVTTAASSKILHLNEKSHESWNVIQRAAALTDLTQLADSRAENFYLITKKKKR